MKKKKKKEWPSDKWRNISYRIGSSTCKLS